VLRVGGLTRLSASDYPDKLAAVVYCQGCPWRCTYCHNPHLLPKTGSEEIPWPEVRVFLEKRRGLLDAVVFSGGEPTLQPALGGAIAEVKAMGYLVGLHTAGALPAALARVLPLVDWVAMDLKAPWAEHAGITRVASSGRRARESMDLIVKSGVACRFHTVSGHGEIVVQGAAVEPGELSA
jgi:pyruvate formate lyase activating enzyme